MTGMIHSFELGPSVTFTLRSNCILPDGAKDLRGIGLARLAGRQDPLGSSTAKHARQWHVLAPDPQQACQQASSKYLCCYNPSNCKLLHYITTTGVFLNLQNGVYNWYYCFRRRYSVGRTIPSKVTWRSQPSIWGCFDIAKCCPDRSSSVSTLHSNFLQFV